MHSLRWTDSPVPAGRRCCSTECFGSAEQRTAPGPGTSALQRLLSGLKSMTSVLTEEVWTLWNLGVIITILAWFMAWTVAAKNMIRRTNMEKQEMVRKATAEIEAAKQKYAKQKKVENKKSK